MISKHTQIAYAIFVIYIVLSKTEHTFNEIDSDCASTEIHCYTDVRLHKINYIWNINHIATYFPRYKTHGKKNNSIVTPVFSSSTNDKFKWYLLIEAAVDKHTDTDTMCIHLCLSNQSKETEVRTKFALSFINKNQKLVNLQRYEDKTFYAFDIKNNHTRWGIRDIPLNEILLPDGNVKIVCNVTFCEYNKNTNKIFHRNGTEFSSYSECNLCQDFDPFIKISNFSDVVLVLSRNGKEYPVHTAILSARSSVFAAMFKNCTQKDGKIKRIEIADMDEAVFDVILQYIYTGECKNLEKLAHGLLVAAHKFELVSLEAICVDAISKNLTVTNAADTLALAEIHGFDDLRSKAIRFISANYAEISNTSDLKGVVDAKGKLIHVVS